MLNGRRFEVCLGVIGLATLVFLAGCGKGDSAAGSPAGDAPVSARPANLPADFVSAAKTDFAADKPNLWADPGFKPKYPLPPGIVVRVEVGYYIWGAGKPAPGGYAVDQQLTPEERAHLKATVADLLTYAWQASKKLKVAPVTPPPNRDGSIGPKSYSFQVSVLADLPFGSMMSILEGTTDAKVAQAIQYAAESSTAGLMHHLDLAYSRETGKKK